MPRPRRHSTKTDIGLLQPAAAARTIGVTRQTIYRALARGRLPFIWVAGLRLIRTADLQRYAIIIHTKPGRPPKRKRRKPPTSRTS